MKAIVGRIAIVVAAVGVGVGLMWAAPLPRPPHEPAPAALPVYQPSKPAHTIRLTATHPVPRKPCGFDARRAYLSCPGYERVFGGGGGRGR